MNNLVVYSLSLLFLKGLLGAEEHRLAYYLGQLHKLRPSKLIVQGEQLTVAL